MSDEHPGCALCRRRSVELFAWAGARGFCLTCLTVMGDFGAEQRWRSEAWEAPPPARARAPEFRPSPALAEDLLQLFNDELAALPRPTEEDLQRQLDLPTEAQTHLDLAIAYREMGLWQDAVRDVAVALQNAVHLPRARVPEAVAMLLDATWLRANVDETLAVIRSTMFAS